MCSVCVAVCLPVSAQVLNTPTTSADHFLPLYLPVTLPTLLSEDWTAQASPTALAWCPSSSLFLPLLPLPVFSFSLVCFAGVPLLSSSSLPIRTIGYGTHFPAALLTGTSRHILLGSAEAEACWWRRRHIACLPSSGEETELDAHRERVCVKEREGGYWCS